jgi:predicted RNase H-like HicB family nuclease
VFGNKANERKRSEMARILVIIEKGENSSGAYAPDVPGCVAVGDTREEVEHLIIEALQEHLRMMLEEHLPLPQSRTEAEYMDIPLSA